MKRESAYPIHQVFMDRWSPRAMSGEPISYKELFTIFEAARWAPSSYNNQPWRFIFAKRGTPHWEKFLALLDELNRVWAQRADVLVIIASKTTFDANAKPSKTHSFDAGAAWQNMALQATFMDNIVTHPLEGFDYHNAAIVADVSDGYDVQAMVAIGRPGTITDLPEQLQEKEQPNDRKMMQDIVFEGKIGT